MTDRTTDHATRSLTMDRIYIRSMVRAMQSTKGKNQSTGVLQSSMYNVKHVVNTCHLSVVTVMTEDKTHTHTCHLSVVTVMTDDKTHTHTCHLSVVTVMTEDKTHVSPQCGECRDGG